MIGDDPFREGYIDPDVYNQVMQDLLRQPNEQRERQTPLRVVRGQGGRALRATSHAGPIRFHDDSTPIPTRDSHRRP